MNRVMIVYEVGINANGDVDLAKKMIDVAVNADHDFVKFQKRNLDLVYSKEELDKPRESPWGTTTREQKQGLEFSLEQYGEIDRYCKSKGIQWFVSVWDPISVMEMKGFNPPYMKVPSPLITNFELLASVKATNIPIIISTGMSDEFEIDECVEFLGDNLHCIMACCSTYPSRDEDMNLSFIHTLKAKYGNRYEIGFSSHSPGVYCATVAPAMGATWIEYHGTLDRALLYGSDQAASIEAPGSMIIGRHIRDLEKAMGDGSWGCRESEKNVRAKLRFNTYRR